MKKSVKKRVHELMLSALDIARLEWQLDTYEFDDEAFELRNTQRDLLIDQYKILSEGLFSDAHCQARSLYLYAYNKAAYLINQPNRASESIHMTYEIRNAHYVEQHVELDDTRSTVSQDGTVTSAASYDEADDLSDDKDESASDDNQSSYVEFNESVFASAFQEACRRIREIDPLDIKTRHPFFSQSRPLPFWPSRLLRAVRTNRIKSVAAMLERGAFDHSVDSQGNTALHIACNQNLIDMIRLLLQHQLNTTVVNKHGRTVMQEAVARHHIPIVSLLLQHELKTQGTYVLPEDLLQMICDNAAHCDHPAEVMPCLLMLNGQGVLTPENTRYLSKIIDRHSSRMDCVRSLHTLHTTRLLQTYLETYQHTDPTQVLHHAIIARDTSFVDTLIQAGFDIELQDQHHRTPLHTSIQEGNIETTRLLLCAGSNIMARDNHGFTALHMASQHNDLDTVQAILQGIKTDDIKTHMDNRTSDGKTALMIAKAHRQDDLVELLEGYYSYQARLNRINYTGDIPEHMKSTISGDIMNDPITISSGITYDRRELHQWFGQKHTTTCPITRRTISRDQLAFASTVYLKNMIEQFVTAKEQAHHARLSP